MVAIKRVQIGVRTEAFLSHLIRTGIEMQAVMMPLSSGKHYAVIWQVQRPTVGTHAPGIKLTTVIRLGLHGVLTEVLLRSLILILIIKPVLMILL
jgi:hypothetical protein